MDHLDRFAEAALRRVKDGYYRRLPAQVRGPPRAPSLHAAIRRAPCGIVAEIKPASPTGRLREVTDPEGTARSLLAAGARGVSVLTEPETFGGSLGALAAAARAGGPSMMKDFLVHEDQFDAAAACGASAVLLILPLHERGHATMTIDEAVEAARARGLETLLEVYDADGLSRARRTRADLLAVNNRDLGDLTLDLTRFPRAALGFAKDRPLLALSGVETAADARRMFDAGADAVLVGGALMRSDDPAGRLAAMLEGQER